MFKDKKYWTLMPFFLTLAIVLLIYLPQDYMPYSLFPIVIFWITYYSWNYIEKKHPSKK